MEGVRGDGTGAEKTRRRYYNKSRGSAVPVCACMFGLRRTFVCAFGFCERMCVTFCSVTNNTATTSNPVYSFCCIFNLPTPPCASRILQAKNMNNNNNGDNDDVYDDDYYDEDDDARPTTLVSTVLS